MGSVELTVLGQLLLDGPLTAGDTARSITWSSGSTTAVIDRIEAAGYVARVPHARDPRGIVVALTDSGRSTIAGIHAATDARMQQAPAGYPPEQVADTTRVMASIREEPRVEESEPAGADR